MRDRRNTHLSNASTSSTSSASSTSSTPIRVSLSEKDIEYQATALGLDQEHKPRKSTRQRWPLLFYRIATTISISSFIALSIWRPDRTATLTWTQSSNAQQHSARTPDGAGGFSFLDSANRDRWTVYIPSNQTFPLPTSDYQHICHDAKRLRSTVWPLHRLWRPATEFISHDATFMDIDEAQGYTLSAPAPADVCQKSLTFVMDDDASFGKTLLLLWLSYGYAKRDGRAFFLDDTNWSYGRFGSYFPPLPRPGCTLPPPSHIVPCPLQAKHVIVTPATARSTFDEDVDGQFHRQTGAKEEKKAFMFDLIRAGFESTFGLIGDDANYAQERVKQLREMALQSHHPLVGMHIRRGDLHPFELQFSQDYLPLERFTDAAKVLLGPTDETPATLVLASDDPDIINSLDLTLTALPHQLRKSQERIQLATKLALDRTSPAEPIREAGSAYVKHVDENAGWDGGFYTALFQSLGDLRPRSQRLLLQNSPPGPMTKETVRMRELIGRGYLIDLAVLSQMDGLVCAVSTAACRVLGVMMGREAIDSGKWLNVDDMRAWSWDGQK